MLRTTLVLAATMGVAWSSAQAMHHSDFILSTVGTGFNNPMGVATDALNRIYVTDSGTGRVLRGNAGNFTTFASGFSVGLFGPYNISAMGITLNSFQEVLVGEGGVGFEVAKVRRYAQDGTQLSSLGVHEAGNNYYGVAENVNTGTVVSTSANGDVLVGWDRDLNGNYSPGYTFADFNLSSQAFASPTGIKFHNDKFYVTAFGNFADQGYIIELDENGNLLRTLQPTGVFKPVGQAFTLDGRLVVADFGSYFDPVGTSKLWTVDLATGSASLIGSGFGRITSITRGIDGHLYFTDMGNPNTNSGKLYKLEVVPEPMTLTALALGLGALARKKIGKNRGTKSTTSAKNVGHFLRFTDGRDSLSRPRKPIQSHDSIC